MVLAKSDGTSLKSHIEDCLVIWRDIKKALCLMPEITGMQNYWDILFSAIFFHDFGKAHVEFQKVLQKKDNYWQNQRHEIYSVPFVEKLSYDRKTKELIQCAILAHHRSFRKLFLSKYKDQETIDFEYKNVWASRGFSAHPEDFVYNLRKKFCFDGVKGLLDIFPELCEFDKIENVSLPNTIVFNEQVNPIKTYAQKQKIFDTAEIEYMQHMLMWGGLKICDHYGSAGITNIPMLENKHFIFIDKLRETLEKGNTSFYSHQTVCFGKNGNCILIAPTGSGKTEAAIGWLKQNVLKRQGRVFYVLPYTASINAMHKRLSRDMDFKGDNELSDIVGIQHGKLSAYLSQYVEGASESVKNLKIKKLREQFCRLTHPIKIITPFQLLKYFYGVKGFEMGFVQMAGAKIIIDEIHAYDVVTFAQILIMLKVLRDKFSSDIFIMTATLPTFMLKEIKKVLHVNREVRADNNFLKKNKRHIIHVIDKSIMDIFDLVEKYVLEGKRIIVVCNTVKRSQDFYLSLIASDFVERDSVVLLHGRFNSDDRLNHEKKALCKDTRVLVGTQAIEVSLDIDYDVMFTEPAPIDALFQRFGRVNRKADKGICPIYVCSIGGEYDHYIYNEEVVERTLAVLRNVNILNEELVQKLLDEVYPGWTCDQKKEFDMITNTFQLSLKSLQPYSDNKEKEEDFYEKFDSIRVLPAQLFDEYKEKVANFDFIGADKLLVNITKGMYFKLKNNIDESQIEYTPIDVLNFHDKIERHHVTVAKCKYDEAIGMTDDYEEMQNNNFI